MPRSIKLKNDTYWDSTAVKDSVRRITFQIGANGSKTIEFMDARYVVLFASKGGYAGSNELWEIHTYGSGTSTRMGITKITTGANSRNLSYTIDGRNLIITNPIDSAVDCSLLLLVATRDVTIS